MNKNEIAIITIITGAALIGVASIRKNLSQARKNKEHVAIIEAKTRHIETLTTEVGRQVASAFEDYRIAVIQENL